MKKNKKFFIALIFILFTVFIYKNFVYYVIPSNPLAKSFTTPLFCSVTKQEPDALGSIGKPENVKYINTSALEECSAILEYISSLKLKPLKQKDSGYGSVNLTYNIRLSSPEDDLIMIFVWLDDLSTIYIGSDKPDFPEGHYKIVGTKFDYEYINSLIENSDE